VDESESSHYWECSECGYSDYTGSVSKEDIEKLQCSNCGNNEFTYI
jgi:translation initiation factor 2 beta subunit (eIF-2beta)/eIF-5